MTMAATKFSSEDRLNRKRQAARIRQQRCRARKRALAAAAVAAAKNPEAAPAQVVVDGNEMKLKRKTQQTAKIMQVTRMQMYPPAQPPSMTSAPPSNDPQTTVDGVRMSKRAAVHAALLDEHNRKFFAQVEAERKVGDKKEDKVEGDRAAPISHLVVTNNHPSHKVSSASTPTRTHSPMHPYYRHAYPPNAYYPYPAYGPRPHGKYTAPPPPHHHAGGYPHSPPPPPPMYRSAYDGRYHPVPPHALPQPTRHFPTMAPPQHSMMDSSTCSAPPPTSVTAVVSHSVSDDDRSTPSQELSPTAAASDEEASYHSMDQKEQEAIAAMLTLSSASVDEETETKPERKETPQPHQQPLVMSQ